MTTVGGRARAWGEGFLTAGLAAVVPARLLGDHLGRHDIVGLETDARWRALLEAATLRHDVGSWLRGGGLPAFEVTPLPTAAQALLAGAGMDAGQAWGWTLAVGVWLAGVGTWRLARRTGAGFATAAGSALLVQLSPVVLAAVPEASLAALSVGAVALGCADARWAWLASGWSVPGAVAMSVMGLGDAWRQAWGRAAMRVVPALALAGIVLARSMSTTVQQGASSVASVEAIAPAYVGEGNAVFPLPEGEAFRVREAAWRAGTGLWLPVGVAPTAQGNPFAAPEGGELGAGATRPRNAPGPDGVPAPSGLRGAPASVGPDLALPTRAQSAAPGPVVDDRPVWGAALVPLQRLHLGPVVVLAWAVGAWQVWRRRSVPRVSTTDVDASVASRGAGGDTSGRTQRAWVLVAGLGLVGMIVAFGWAAAPGELVHDPAAAERLAGVLGGPDGGWRPWGALVLAACVVGLAAALEGFALRWRVLVVVAGAAASVGLENPRLRSFGTPLPPDPVLTALAGLPDGEAQVFPSPAAPWLQGQRPASRVAWELAEAGRSVPPPSDTLDAWTVALARAAGAPIDIAAAERAWAVRTVNLTDRTASSSAAPRYLLVDATALTPVGLAELERWLTPRMGAPVARSDTRLLYDRTTLLAGDGR